MSEYVNRCRLEVNGGSFEDFESYTEGSVTKAKQVNLMNKTGHALMTPRHTFSAVVKENVVPGIDVTNVRNGTVTVDKEGGTRITYGGVYTLEDGDGTIDGETELSRTVNYGAETKVEE